MPLDLDEFIAELTAGREKNKECTPLLRVAMCTLVASGRSEKSVARQFRVSDATVRHTIRHWKAHKNFDSGKRSGRPRKNAKRETDASIGNGGAGGDADAEGENEIHQLQNEGDTTMYDTSAAEMTMPEIPQIPETSTPTSEAAREASIQNIMNA